MKVERKRGILKVRHTQAGAYASQGNVVEMKTYTSMRPSFSKEDEAIKCLIYDFLVTLKLYFKWLRGAFPPQSLFS